MSEDRDALALAERVMGILEDGRRSSTYKLALFTAILDLCIEKKFIKGIVPESLTTRHIAQRVVELYWNHVVPYRGIETLRQGGNQGEQAEIVRRIQEARAKWAKAETDTPYRASLAHGEDFRRLVLEVEWKLIEWPIPRLQKLGQHEDRFIYDYAWREGIKRSTVRSYQLGENGAFNNALTLRHGVAEHLVRLNGILRPLFHREWAVMVARRNELPEAELETFLFRPERLALDTVRQPLRELQDHRCFYCRDRITGRADVDHFIPWARYPDDGLDNLVVADPKCNNKKRDFLAAAKHVERWKERLKADDSDLATIAASVGWRRDTERTTSIAKSIYSRLPLSTPLWVELSTFEPNVQDRILAALED